MPKRSKRVSCICVHQDLICGLIQQMQCACARIWKFTLFCTRSTLVCRLSSAHAYHVRRSRLEFALNSGSVLTLAERLTFLIVWEILCRSTLPLHPFHICRLVTFRRSEGSDR